MNRDRIALPVACLALALATVGTIGPAAADSISEPDAAALAERVSDLESQVEQLDSSRLDQAGLVDDLFSNDAVLDERTGAGTASACIAYSDYHYVREQVNGRGRKWRLPLAAWNMADPGCRVRGKVWKPKPRVLVPLHTNPTR